VLEALAGRETEFVRTPKHGVRGKLESWSSKKYRAAKSITPFIELGMAAYFVVALGVAFEHGHYMSMPFLALFLAGFGYVGWVSLWQGGIGLAVRGALARLVHRPAFAGLLGAREASTAIVPPPAFVVLNAKSAAQDVSFDEEADALGASAVARSAAVQ